MKKTKAIYDDLVHKIQSGEEVHFGEMEELFANALLSRYIKKQAWKPKKETVEDQEQYPDRCEARVKYELDITKGVIGALGVRPEEKDLSDYITFAVETKDWDILNTTLSLTKERNLCKGMLEEIALGLLVEGDEHSFSEFKDQFENLRFTEEVVHPYYEKLLSKEDIRGLGRLKKETKVAFSSVEISQAKKYGLKLLQRCDFSNYDKLKNIIDSDFEFSSNEIAPLKKELIKKLKENPCDSDNLRNIEGVNKRLNSAITVTAEELKEIIAKYFDKDHRNTRPKRIADCLNQTLDSNQILERYNVLLKQKYRKRAIEQVKDLEDNTSISASNAVNGFLKDKDFKEQLKWVKELNKKSEYIPSDDILNNMIENLHRNENYQRVYSLMRSAKKAPSEDIAQDIIDFLFEGHIKHTSYTPPSRHQDYYLEKVCASLTNEYNHALSTERVHKFVDAHLESGDCKSLGNCILRLKTVYNSPVEFDETQQRKAANVIENYLHQNSIEECREEIYSKSKEWLSQIPNILSNTAVRHEIGDRIAELMSGQLSGFIRGAYCCEITGIDPSFTTEQFHGCIRNLERFKDMFSEDYLPGIVAKIEVNHLGGQ